MSGIVSGPGILTKVGEGTLILTGANTYTGNIQNNGGTLQGNTTSLRNNIVFDASDNPVARSVTFDQAADGTFAGNITGKGSFTKIEGDGPGDRVVAGVEDNVVAQARGVALQRTAVVLDIAGVSVGTTRGSCAFTDLREGSPDS